MSSFDKILQTLFKMRRDIENCIVIRKSGEIYKENAKSKTREIYSDNKNIDNDLIQKCLKNPTQKINALKKELHGYITSIAIEEVIDIFREEKKIRLIFAAFGIIAQYCEEYAFQLIDLMLSKTNAEKDFENINACLSPVLTESSKPIKEEIIRKLDINCFNKKILSEKNLIFVIEFIKPIAFISIEKAEQFVETVVERLDAEENGTKVISFFRHIDPAPGSILMLIPPIAGKIVEKINIEKIKKIIPKEENIEHVGSFMSEIVKLNVDIGLKLLDVFVEKMKEVKQLSTLADVIRRISNSDRNMGKLLINRLDFDTIADLMDKEEDSEDKEYYTYIIAKADKEIAERLRRVKK